MLEYYAIDGIVACDGEPLVADDGEIANLPDAKQGKDGWEKVVLRSIPEIPALLSSDGFWDCVEVQLTHKSYVF